MASTRSTLAAGSAPAARPGALALEDALAAARDAVLADQAPDGAWCYPLEADVTIPAELVLMMHWLDEVEPGLQERLAAYVRRGQGEDGGWPLYHGGALELSATVKAYWALKLAGDDPAAPHMARARAAVLARGGAARSNVFTRIALALFGLVPWRATPFLPAEIVLLPRWFPFCLGKVSYWSRTVMVPLAVLCSLRARAANPTGTTLDELFVRPPAQERDWFPARSRANRRLLRLERLARLCEPLLRITLRRRALRRAEAWILERLNGEDGLGAIFPAMVGALEALLALGHARDSAPCRQAARAIERLVVLEEDGRAWCQPCFSPVWDTALASLALQESLAVLPCAAANAALARAHAWLEERQVLDGPADWRAARPGLAPGGWPFQYANAHYPDLDDTAVAAWALWRSDRAAHARAIGRAADWLCGMQSRDGGFAAFDADNTHAWLNEIPFADHGALLDPPTADVTARVSVFLARLGRPGDAAVLARALDWLLAAQEPDGSWFGRWGTNHVYGTWSALCALEAVEDPRKADAVRRAVLWLERAQREDGGWGESNDTYWPAHARPAGRPCPSTPFQTAWALLGLQAAGAGGSPAAARGAQHLLATQGADGAWASDEHTAPGFPRVFYLRYHGYRRIFPLWALARHAALAAASR